MRAHSRLTGEPCLSDTQCDEARPKCSQCMVKNRICKYSSGSRESYGFVDEKGNFYGFTNPGFRGQGSGGDSSSSNESDHNASERSFLYVRSSKATGYGTGVYATLSSIRLEGVGGVLATSPSLWTITRTPSSSCTLLTSRWLSIIAHDWSTYERMQTLCGTWITLIATRIGISSLVDSSITYLLDGVIALRARTEQLSTSEHSLRVARASNARALSHLRSAVGGESQDDRSNTILAVRIIGIAEVRVALHGVRLQCFTVNPISSLCWVFHFPIFHTSLDFANSSD